MFKRIKSILLKELTIYFTTPPIYIFIITFLFLTIFFTFASSPFGALLSSDDTNISSSFFIFHPWLFLVLIPTIGMRLWAEEKKSGTVELLFTMPIRVSEIVVGKYLAALVVIGVSLLMTLSVAITVNWLGTPDNNIIISGYIASFLLAASYLAICSMVSAITENQIVSFIISFLICLILALIGHPTVTDFFINWAPMFVINLMTTISIFPHFEMLSKGIVDFKDILYFASIIFIGLYGTIMFLTQNSWKRFIKVTLLIVIITNLNFIIGGMFTVRVDMTSDGIYTLSQGTKNILQNLPHRVTVRYYCSSKNNRLPVQLKSYAKRIGEILHEYSAASNGKLKVERIDPIPDSALETSAMVDGIRGNILPNGEKCYFGLNINSLGYNQAISFLTPESEKTIEYDLTRSIYDLTNRKKPNIGILSSLPIMGDPSMSNYPWVFVQELQRLFSVSKVDYNSTKIPKETDVLLVFHPKNLSKETEYAIDQYLLNGGKLLIFTDPYCLTETLMSMNEYSEPVKPSSSSLPELFNAWGIDFDKANSVLLAPDNVYRSQNNPMNGENPGIIELEGDRTINPRNIITSNLNKINYVFGGRFTIDKPKSDLRYTPLLQTGKNSGVVKYFEYSSPLEDILRRYKSGNAPSGLSLMINGDFLSAFPNGKKEFSDEKYLSKSSKESSVIVIGDVDMMFNSFVIDKQETAGEIKLSQINSNLDFVLNAVDQLSGSQDIIEIRTKGVKKRRFEKIDELFAKEKERYKGQLQKLEKQLQKNKEFAKKYEEKEERKALTPDELEKMRELKLQEKRLIGNLRDVRKQLRESVNRLKLEVEIFNVGFGSIIIVFLGIFISIRRYRKSNK